MKLAKRRAPDKRLLYKLRSIWNAAKVTLPPGRPAFGSFGGK